MLLTKWRGLLQSRLHRMRRRQRRSTDKLQKPSRRLFEQLEDRLLLTAVHTVTNTDDSGPGSLRQTILDANANPGADTIAFDMNTAYSSLASRTSIARIR